MDEMGMKLGPTGAAGDCGIGAGRSAGRLLLHQVPFSAGAIKWLTAWLPSTNLRLGQACLLQTANEQGHKSEMV